jgi:hypothetical protein
MDNGSRVVYCQCVRENDHIYTAGCELHDAATIIKEHEFGGKDPESCYYCEFPKPDEVHQMEKKLDGKKHDGGKPPMALLSSDALFEIAKVLEFGAKKYDAWNWKGGFKWVRISSAVLRHIFSWLRGEDKDPETGLSHLAHASCGLMFLLDFEVNHLGEDDRYKKAK